MSNCKNAQAVAELLKQCSPDILITNLDELWEGWLTSELTDGAKVTERAERLFAYKALREMLRNINTGSC